MSGAARKEQRKREAQLRQDRAAKLKPLEDRLATVEATIEALEKEKAALVKLMQSPEFYEESLRGHAAVADAAALGLPDRQWGERVACVVVLHDGAAVDADELREHVKAELRSSRTPEVIEFRDDLPYNDTGKLLRRQLRDELAHFGDEA